MTTAVPAGDPEAWTMDKERAKVRWQAVTPGREKVPTFGGFQSAGERGRITSCPRAKAGGAFGEGRLTVPWEEQGGGTMLTAASPPVSREAETPHPTCIHTCLPERPPGMVVEAVPSPSPDPGSESQPSPLPPFLFSLLSSSHQPWKFLNLPHLKNK